MLLELNQLQKSFQILINFNQFGITINCWNKNNISNPTESRFESKERERERKAKNRGDRRKCKFSDRKSDEWQEKMPSFSANLWHFIQKQVTGTQFHGDLDSFCAFEKWVVFLLPLPKGLGEIVACF